jgi:hypothetical protein
MTNKIAILLECDPGNTLGGSCIRDVHNMSKALTERGFICHMMLSADRTSSKFLERITELAGGEYDMLVVLISGHGFGTSDQATTGDEVDGQDEMIHTTGGVIIDDQIYAALQSATRHIKQMVLLSDTCQSGTMFDLPYRLDRSNRLDRVRNAVLNTRRIIDPDFCPAISISACSDSQSSMCDIGETTGFGGSLTTAVLDIPGVLDQLLIWQILPAFDLIESRLKMLGQTAVLSSSTDHIL